MKKIIAAALLPIMLLCSCNAKSTKPDTMPESYKTDVLISDNGREFSGSFCKDEQGWEYEFSAPESIKGMKLSKTAEGFTAELEKLKITDAPEKLPQNSPARLIAGALEMCESGKGVTAEYKGGKVVNKGVINGADFEVTFDDGIPCSMEIGSEIAVTFKNFASND